MAEMILRLIKLMSGTNVPGIDQNKLAVCVRDSIAAESFRTTDCHKLYSIEQNNSISFLLLL